jgi:hypothetical protein
LEDTAIVIEEQAKYRLQANTMINKFFKAFLDILSHLSASLMKLLTGSNQNSQFWGYRAQMLDYRD